MIEKLEIIHHRFHQVQEQLSDPEIVSDNKRFAKLNKEYKKLDKMNNVYLKYKNLLANKENAEEMQKDDDLEMKEMAKAELDELLPAIAEIEE